MFCSDKSAGRLPLLSSSTWSATTFPVPDAGASRPWVMLPVNSSRRVNNLPRDDHYRTVDYIDTGQYYSLIAVVNAHLVKYK